MSKIEFETLIKKITDTISKKPVDDVLEKFLTVGQIYKLQNCLFGVSNHAQPIYLLLFSIT